MVATFAVAVSVASLHAYNVARYVDFSKKFAKMRVKMGPSYIACCKVPPYSGASVASILSRTSDPEKQEASDERAARLSKGTARQRARRLQRQPMPAPPAPAEPSESEILHLSSLRTFDDTLSQEDAEVFLSALTAPSLRLPLVLSFFAGHRVGALFNAEIRSIVESVMFEPGAFLAPGEFWQPPAEPSSQDAVESPATVVVEAAEGMNAVDKAANGETVGPTAPVTSAANAVRTALGLDQCVSAHNAITVVPVPAADRAMQATKHGVLLTALLAQPSLVVHPLLELARSAAELCRGDFRSAFVDLLLFVVTLATRVHSYLRAAVNMPTASSACASQGAGCLRMLAGFFTDTAIPMVTAWMGEAEDAAHTTRSTLFHAHAAVLYAACLGDSALSEQRRSVWAGRLAASAAFVTSWFTPKSHPNFFLLDTGKPTQMTARQAELAKTAAAQQQQQSEDAKDGDGTVAEGGDEGQADKSECVPTLAVFRQFQRWRTTIVQSIQNGTPDDRNKTLGAILRAALRQEGLAGTDWVQVPAASRQCELVLESEHPYLPGQQQVRTVSFPGASSITVRFDDRSRTEKDFDRITFFKVGTQVLVGVLL